MTRRGTSEYSVVTSPDRSYPGQVAYMLGRPFTRITGHH
jgi:hypothetical protein